MKTTIIFPRGVEYQIQVRRPEAEVTSAQSESAYGARDFMLDFVELAKKVHAPWRTPSGMDYGVASRLLKKFSPDRLKELARLFWLLYSEPVFTQENVKVMALFERKILDIEREL